MTHPRWTFRPAPLGLTVALLFVAASQINAIIVYPWPIDAIAMCGLVVCLTAVGMFAAGWWTQRPDWARRAYFLAATVFTGHAIAVWHMAHGGFDAGVQAGIEGSLALISICSWRAEVEAEWRSRQRS